MGVSYIVYCSGHFSKKAAKIFLRLTIVILALGPKKQNLMTRIILTIIVATNFEHTYLLLACVYVTMYLSEVKTPHLLATNLDDCHLSCPSNLQESQTL